MGIEDIKEGSIIIVKNEDNESVLGVVENINHTVEGNCIIRAYRRDLNEHHKISMYIEENPFID